MILENLAVSLDQIGGSFSGSMANGQAMLAALDAYLSPARFREINHARTLLGDYIADEEAEALADNKIPYWNYAGLKKLKKLFSAGNRKAANGKKAKAMS